MLKISLVVTTLNEAEHIDLLLSSILFQNRRPDEVIIVDGGSGDQTLEKIKDFQKNIKNLNLKVFTKKGNRSVGRNFAIKKAKHPWIAITDAGCTLHKNWLKELELVQKKSKIKIIAGYYDADPVTPLEEALVPYFLVMPDKVDENNFLPATRSMMIEKQTFEKLGSFDEKLSHNEDYALAQKIKKANLQIKFTGKAKATWIPINNLAKFSRAIFRFAKGDIEAGILRPKVLTIFVRYLIFICLYFFNIYVFGLLFLLYLNWSIYKNYKYLTKFKAYYYLPILQVLSDLSVMGGTTLGIIDKTMKSHL